jgi:hypothetical protein
MPGTDAYYYLSGTQGEVGPLDAPALRDLRARKVIAETTLIRQGEGPWLAFADHPALRPAAPGAASPTDSIRRYPVAASARALLTVIAVGIGGLFAWMGLLPFHSSQMDIGGWAFLWTACWWGLTAFFLAIAWDAWVSVVIVSPEGIEQRGLRGANRLRFDEIAGYRLATGKARALILIPREAGRKALKIDSTCSGWKEICAWAPSRFVDLTAAEVAEATQKLLDDATLGGTPEQRAVRLAQARKATQGIFVAVAAVSFGGLLPGLPAGYPLLLALVPLASLSLLWIFRGYVTLDGTITDPRPKVAPLLFTPLIVLALRAFRDTHPLTAWWCLAIPSAILGMLGVILLRPAIGARQPLFGRLLGIFSVFLILSLGGYGLLMESDVLLDTGAAASYPTAVASASISHGSKGGVTYHVGVLGWPDHPAPETFQVSRAFFNTVHRGESVTVLVHPGFWHVPWGNLSTRSSVPPAAN